MDSVPAADQAVKGQPKPHSALAEMPVVPITRPVPHHQRAERVVTGMGNPDQKYSLDNLKSFRKRFLIGSFSTARQFSLDKILTYPITS